MVSMNNLLSPKQIARAMAVSESSVKRWCDRGDIETQYTAGGHRRVSLPGLIEFTRHGKREIVHPEAIGLPALSRESQRTISQAVPTLAESILSGNEDRARQIVFALYLDKLKVSTICDQLIAAAFQQIGHQWQCGEIDAYQERQSCEIVVRVLNELRQLTPSAPASSPLAIGCPAPGDPYSMGSLMAELVLREQNWRTISLGSNLPWESLRAAIHDHRPQIFWLSCSSISNEATFLTNYNELRAQAEPQCEFVVGGRALTPAITDQMKKTRLCSNLLEFEQLAAKISGERS